MSERAPLPPIGALVAYRPDTRWVCARHIFIVLDHARDKDGDLAPVIRTACDNHRLPFLAKSSDCDLPIAFGMELGWIDCRIQGNDTEIYNLQFRPIPFAPKTAATKWGRLSGAVWDHMGRAVLHDNAWVPMIRKWMVDSRDRSREPVMVLADAEHASEPWPTCG